MFKYLTWAKNKLLYILYIIKSKLHARIKVSIYLFTVLKYDICQLSKERQSINDTVLAECVYIYTYIIYIIL